MRGAEESQHREGGAGELRQPVGDAGTASPMAVFIPPAVFDEEKAVLDFPMSPHVGQQLGGRHSRGIETGQKVACIAE